MIDPSCRDIIFHLKIGDNDPAIHSFNEYYMPLAEIKDFNVLIYNKQLCDKLVEGKREDFEKHVKMPKNDDYMTGKLLDFIYPINIIINLLV